MNVGMWRDAFGKKQAILLLTLGLAIREALAPFTGHPYDFELWIRVGYYVSFGFNPYQYHSPIPGLSMPLSDNPSWPGYPPLWPLLLAGLYKIYALGGIQNRFFYYFILKQPIILSDVIDSIFIFKLVARHSSLSNAFKAMRFWLLCPFVIIISAVWGMFDSIVLLFVLLAILSIKESVESSLLESVGIALKLIPVIFFPLFAGVQSSWRRILAYLLAGIGFSLIFSLAAYLYFPSWGLSGITGVAISQTNRVATALNYWEIIFTYSLQNNLPASIYNVLLIIGLAWIPAVILASLFCITRIRGKTGFEKNLIISSLAITLVFFLTKSAISEQFLIYFLGFATFDYYVLSQKNRRIIFHAIWISAFAFLTLNNFYLISFLSPVSAYFPNLGSYITNNVIGIENWSLLIDACSLVFTFLSLLYLVSLLRVIRGVKTNSLPATQNSTPIVSNLAKVSGMKK